MKKLSILVVAVLVGMAGAQDGFAKSKKEKKAEEEAKKAHNEMMMRGAPGENHKVLDALIGNWNHTVRWWQAPGQPPQEMKGTNSNTWILGNRFVQQEVKGGSPEMPFEGKGFTGYDNLTNEYNSVWLDSMSTSMMKSTGKWDPNSKTMTERGTYNDTMTGKTNQPYRATWRMVDPNTSIYEMFTTGPDGQEFRSMEIVYTRAQ